MSADAKIARRLIAAAVVALAVGSTYPAPRSSSARAAFVKVNPCPATGAIKGRCPGYLVDLISPLCAGGADAPHNMQWQTVADAKDRSELAQCRSRKR